MTYYALKALSWLGLVWDVRAPSPRLLDASELEPTLITVPEAEQTGTAV